jgi:hypothetical protein
MSASERLSISRASYHHLHIITVIVIMLATSRHHITPTPQNNQPIKRTKNASQIQVVCVFNSTISRLLEFAYGTRVLLKSYSIAGSLQIGCERTASAANGGRTFQRKHRSYAHHIFTLANGGVIVQVSALETFRRGFAKCIGFSATPGSLSSHFEMFRTAQPPASYDTR